MRNKHLFLMVLLFGQVLSLNAQHLPNYGVVRLQTAPELSFGAAAIQAVEHDGKILLQGVGWDTAHIYTRGYFTSSYDGQHLQTLFFDTINIRSGNDPERGSAMVFADGVASIRTANYNPVDTVHTFSGYASILEFTRTTDSSPEVFLIDTLWLSAQETEEVSGGFTTRGVRRSSTNDSDTIRYVFNVGFQTSRDAIVEIRSYVADSVRGLRLVRTVPLVQDMEPNEFQICTWEMGDTLGRAELTSAGRATQLEVNYWNVHTGELLSNQLVDDGVDFVARAIASPAAELVYLMEIRFRIPEPNVYVPVVAVTAYSMHDMSLVWEREYEAQEDWYTSPSWNLTRIDSAGRVALNVFPASQPFANGGNDNARHLEVHAADARTGDSLWITSLQLDTSTTRGHDLTSRDLAFRSKGKGYIVVASVAETKLDPVRDLRYSYTALFFLDSLGCLAPGCRDASATEERVAPYRITLAPNPVAAGQEVQIHLPSASTGTLRYSLTNANGRSLSSGEQVPGVEQLSVSTDGLPAGMYYLTVWPEDLAQSVVTRAFVVE